MATAFESKLGLTTIERRVCTHTRISANSPSLYAILRFQNMAFQIHGKAMYTVALGFVSLHRQMCSDTVEKI